MVQFLRGIALIAAVMLNCGAAFAQTPPTATEAFNLRIKCKQMADDKADSMQRHPLTVAEGAGIGLSARDVDAINSNYETTTENLFSSHSSRYDAKSNRCYIETLERKKLGRNKETELQYRQIYDGQTDEVLAFAQILNGKKVGLVFDPEHRQTTNTNLGWDDANAYIDEMMLEKRR
jgi:hypothetical protein